VLCGIDALLRVCSLIDIQQRLVETAHGGQHKNTTHRQERRRKMQRGTDNREGKVERRRGERGDNEQAE